MEQTTSIGQLLIGDEPSDFDCDWCGKPHADEMYREGGMLIVMAMHKHCGRMGVSLSVIDEGAGLTGDAYEAWCAGLQGEDW